MATKNESNKGDSKGVKSLTMKLYLQLKPLWNNYTEYKEYLELNYNAVTGSIEHNQIELYRNKVLRQWNRVLFTIETLEPSIPKNNKNEILIDILSEYYQLFKKQSHFPEITDRLFEYASFYKDQANKFDRSENPVPQISEQKKDFTDWVEINRDLIISENRKAKWGWRIRLFESASKNYSIPEKTFYRHLKKFVENLK